MIMYVYLFDLIRYYYHSLSVLYADATRPIELLLWRPLRWLERLWTIKDSQHPIRCRARQARCEGLRC